MDNVLRGIYIGIVVVTFLLNTSRVLKAIELCKECLIVLNNKALGKEKELVRFAYMHLYFQICNGYDLINDHTSAIEWGRKLLLLLRESGEKGLEGNVTYKLAEWYKFQGKYKEAKDFFMKALSIMIETGDRKIEGVCYAHLGIVYECLHEYAKAKEYHEKSLAIRKQIGDKSGEAACYLNIATVFQSLGNCMKAEEHLQKALTISKEIGYKDGEATGYAKLGSVFQCLGNFAKAEEYLQKAVVIRKEIGDKNREATDYGNLATVFLDLSEYAKAEECLQKTLSNRKEVGDRKGEATCYGNLGAMFKSVGDFAKAEDFLQKALVIRREIGDRNGEAADNGNLGSLFQSVGDYVKAKECLEKALAITKEIGDKSGEAGNYENFGNVFLCVGDYAKAKECHEKALSIRKETGEKVREASSYENLANVFYYLADYAKAEEYLLKSLAITKEIGGKHGKATNYGKLGTVCCSIGEYAKAKEYLQKELAISQEIGGKHGEASVYGNLGIVFHSTGEYVKAEEYLQKALAMNKEIGDKAGVARDYANLGDVFLSLGEYAKAKEYHEKGLVLSNEIGSTEVQFRSQLLLTLDNLLLGGTKDEAVLSLFACIKKCEKMRDFLRGEEQLNIWFSDEHILPYNLLSALLCSIGNPSNALYVTELGRARALGDLMSAQYSVVNQISVNPQSWVGIDKIVKKESNCACLYISSYEENILLWILKSNKMIDFRRINVNDCFSNKLSKRSVDEVFDDVTLRNCFHMFSQGHCEDRSLFPSNHNHSTRESSQEDSFAAGRLLEEDEDEHQHLEPPSLAQCYDMIIAPVADLLDKPGIIIVPDRALYKVPFAALKDESDKYLSETFRIRIVPSLTTLRLIQDSPADYHSQTGALIVGDPEVDRVYYKGYVEKLCPLPCAKEEAEMIGRLIPGAQLLLGKEATKQAVLERIQSVSLIHFAAHGNAERGEIALAPLRAVHRIP